MSDEKRLKMQLTEVSPLDLIMERDRLKMGVFDLREELARVRKEMGHLKSDYLSLLSSVESAESRIGPARLPESIQGELQAIVNLHRRWISRGTKEDANAG